LWTFRAVSVFFDFFSPSLRIHSPRVFSSIRSSVNYARTCYAHILTAFVCEMSMVYPFRFCFSGPSQTRVFFSFPNGSLRRFGIPSFFLVLANPRWNVLLPTFRMSFANLYSFLPVPFLPCFIDPQCIPPRKRDWPPRKQPLGQSPLCAGVPVHSLSLC